MGVQLIGHVRGEDGARNVAADDLAESVQVGAEAFSQICAGIVRLAAARGEPTPDLPDAPTSVPDAAEPPRLADLGVIVKACGYRPAYEWIDIPGLVDAMGFPLQEDGASLTAPGLWFVGVPWMRTRKIPAAARRRRGCGTRRRSADRTLNAGGPAPPDPALYSPASPPRRWPNERPSPR